MTDISSRLNIALILLRQGGETGETTRPSAPAPVHADGIKPASAAPLQTVQATKLTGASGAAAEAGEPGKGVYLTEAMRNRAFESEIVRITALEPGTKEAWAEERYLVWRRLEYLVGGVVAANAKFQTVDKIEKPDDKLTLDRAEFFMKRNNEFIERENQNKEHNSEVGIATLGFNIAMAGFGNVVYDGDDGQKKIKAFKINSSDGKLMAEMREDGHIIEYNQDGSVWADNNRRTVAAMGDSVIYEAQYGRLAGLTHTEDKDFMFY